MKAIYKLTFIFILALTFNACSNSDNNNEEKIDEEKFVADPAKFEGKIKDGETITLDASKEYSLTGSIVIEDGGKLTIPAGTVIKGSGGTASYIAVAQGGMININGTKDNPVVMTSAQTTPSPGDWGGLVICGKAPTNKGGSNGETAIAEVTDLTYGGTVANDSSGSIRYLRVEYTGVNFTDKKEFNGVSLFGVGSGTTFEYVQSYKGSDDGVEFFGGTVNAKYIVSTDSEDDGIDFTDGWKGTGENWYVVNATNAGIEGGNNGNDANAEPETEATLKNISIISNTEATPKQEGALYYKEGGGKWSVQNVYVKGYKTDKKGPIYIIDSERVRISLAANFTIDPIQLEDSAALPSGLLGVVEGDNTGAGKGADKPTWAEGWTR